MNISIKDIEETTAYGKLDTFKKRLVVKASNRQLIQEAFIHYKNHSQFISSVNETNLSILKEIIQKNQINNN